MIKTILLLMIAFLFLIWSADRLISGASNLARNAGISPLVIGTTILAIGSSAPEMVLSATAALDGKTDTAVGNVLGSNITNIALILGLTAMIKPLSIKDSMIRQEFPLMMLAIIVAGVILWDNYLSFYESILLFCMFSTFIVIVLHTNRKKKDNNASFKKKELKIPKKTHSIRSIVWIAISLIILPISANNLIHNALIIAKYLGMSDLVIGLTIIAVGTSLPELATSLMAGIKNETDMLVGNIVGSNIFNILAVLGTLGVLNPSILNEYAMKRDFWIMLGLSLLFIIMALGKSRSINFISGTLLFILFVSYQIYLIINIHI
ncbi:calcium/sodium antiporter [Candidatus Photodesmus katoptron]|uniref:calcium/sodium antiporter n=1 Tax=Candidatus Photodesmus anomalopis TaxID=28176 RepID=UPI00054FBC87|nr:calcium/sodium antiporter [Candidatus Photodesmus katoptron]